MGQSPASKPQFVINTEKEPISLGLKALEDDINTRPKYYQALLSDLGEQATFDSLSPQEARIANFGHIEVGGDAIARIRQFFRFRFDGEVDFDPETETSLMHNGEYQARRVNMSGAQAESVRDKLRRLRLEHYIGRVISWQEQNPNLDSQTDEELRSVS